MLNRIVAVKVLWIPLTLLLLMLFLLILAALPIAAQLPTERPIFRDVAEPDALLAFHSGDQFPDSLTLEVRRNQGSYLLHDLISTEATRLTGAFYLAEPLPQTFALANDPTPADSYDDLANVYVGFLPVAAQAQRLVVEIGAADVARRETP